MNTMKDSTAAPKKNKMFFWLQHSLVIIFILIMIFLAEVWLLPSLLKTPRQILLFRHAAIPGVMVEGQIINNMGFSGDVLHNPKPENTIRILLLGGSVMFRHHVGDELKIELQKHSLHKKIELLNAALPTHTSRSDLYKMRYLAKYQFDYVIYYNGINDLWMNARYPLGFQNDYSHYNAWYKKNPFFEYSLIAQYLYKGWWTLYFRVNRSDYDDWDFNHENYASIQAFHDNILSIINTARQHGSKPILTTFAYTIPANYTRDAFNQHQLGYVAAPGYRSTPVELWGYPEYVSTALNRINQSMREISKTQDTPLIDIDHDLSGKITLFADVCHFNAEGTHVFAQQMANFFYQNHLLE